MLCKNVLFVNLVHLFNFFFANESQMLMLKPPLDFNINCSLFLKVCTIRVYNSL